MITLILFALLLFYSLAGTISRPLGLSPIWNSVANANVQAQYIFNFVLETYLPQNSQLEVVFPQQYADGLGTTSSNLVCVPSCVLKSRTITFTYTSELKNGTTYTASVQPILNPSSQGGTANFILRTKRGDNVIDENLIFDIIGIAGVIQKMVFGEITVNPSGSLSAGDYTQYILKFKTSTAITSESYFLFTIPNQFTLEPFPVCSSYAINGISLTGTLFCSQVNQTNVVKIEGVVGKIQDQQDYAIMISMRNPKYAGLTSSFSLGVYKANTQMMYESVDSITGVTIEAAQLQNVSLSQAYQFDNSQSRIMDYVVKFTPKFPIPSGCNIKLVFPVNMQILMPSDFNQNNKFQMHYVNYGLEDLNENSPLGFYYLDSIQNYLRITNFKEMNMTNEISVTVRVINPSVVGYTTPLKIYVYQDLTEFQLLQSDVLYGVTIITSNIAGNQNVPAPTSTALTYLLVPRSGFFPNYNDLSSTPTTLIADQSLITQLKFNVDPSQTIPAQGYIVIYVPSEFKMATSITNTECQVYNINGATFVNSQSCTIDDQILTFKLPTTYSMDIILNSPSDTTPAVGTNQQYFILNNVMYTPSLNGTYYFNITLYDTDLQTILNTYTQPITIEANVLTTLQLQSIPITKAVKSILQISFTTLLNIPSGQTQYKAQDERGFIELHFTGWATDLGTGISNGQSIPCYGVNSLIPYDGNTLNCILRVGTTPIVVISNFREIPPNTKVKLLLSGLTNPNANYQVQIKLFKKINRIYYLLNQQTATGIVANAPGSMVSATCTTPPAYSQNKVGYLFDMSISLCVGASIIANTQILFQLPIYDVGFVRLENTVTCNIGIYQVYCIPLVGSDFVLMISPSSTIPMTPTPVFKINNLQWPRYVKSFSSSTLKVYVLNTAYDLLQSLTFSTLNNCVPAQFDNIQSLVPFKGKGFVDASYTFQFTPQANIPIGSTIVLEFPSFYNFLSGTHQPTFTYKGLSPVSSSTTVSIQVNIRLIKITGFALVEKGTELQIKAESVKNSESYQSATGFNLYVLYQDQYVLQQSNFFSFDFTTAFKAGKVVINQISASILNADEEADYLIQFTPQNDIPIGGSIKVAFPTENYKKLPSSPDCRISGGMNTFQSCVLNGNTFIIETNSRYYSGSGIIGLTIKDVQNPDQGTTGGFLINTEFEGVSLDLTDESTLNGRTYTAAKKTNSITVNSITFDPQNEGEEASYSFNFVSYATLNSTSEMYFKFPKQFDPTLGRDVQCKVTNGLIGNSYSCTASDRIVSLKGFESYTPDNSNPIQVTLFGIVNPNVNSDGSATDYIKIYIKQANSNIYDESNSQAAQFSFLAAPGWSPLLSLSIETFNVRWNSTYNFSFQAYSNIPKVSASGSILFDFPSQFEIPDGSITCSSTTAFATSLTCTSYRNRITAQGNYYDYVGKMYVVLKDVSNPIEQGQTDFLYIRTYDGLNFKIIERNFANLDPYKYTFTYPGPLIKVNGDNIITVERGTQVLNIQVSIESPSVLNLILAPSSTNFTINPEKIPIKLGMTLTTFNLSVAQDNTDGVYTIYWTLENEMDPPLYTPVKRTQIKVTKSQHVLITQTPILSIPILGQSLITEYLLNNPPDTELTVNLYLQQAYYALSLDKNIIKVQPGQNKFGFTINYDKNVNSNGSSVERGYVTLSLSGINDQIYAFSQSIVEFQIITQDTKDPIWITNTIANIKKTSVDLIIALDEPCIVYYLIALNGTVFPSKTQFQQQLISYSTTQSQYGYQIVQEGNVNYTINLKNLISQTTYVIHILAIDRGNNQATQISKQFTTEQRGDSCYFTLIFNQKSLSSEYIKNVTYVLADIFGIDNSYIQQQKYYLSRRLLQNSFSVQVDEVKSYLDLELGAIPNSESFPDPVEVIEQIVNKTTLLTSDLPTLNLTQEVSVYKFVRYIPRFVKQPSIVFIDYQQCAIQLAISNYGWGFAIAVKFESNSQPIPSPYQISKGLDYQNRPTPNGTIEITQSYQDFILNIVGLSAQTDYFIYVIGGSVHFKQPDLMENEQIYMDRVITFSAPASPTLNIGNTGQIMGILLIILLLIK